MRCHNTLTRIMAVTIPVLVHLCLAQIATAQPFTTIIDVPPDIAPSSIGSDTQLNLTGNGQLGSSFYAGLLDGSSTNVEVNISGGIVGADFVANDGSTVNITGGKIHDTFYVNTGCEVFLSGGDIGRFSTLADSSLTIYGDEFQFGDAPIPGLNNFGDSVTLTNHFVNRLSGTLADGSVFVFSTRLGDYLTNQTVTVVKTAVPPAGISVINVPADAAPKDLRPGQTLNLSTGGSLVDGFVAVDADINMSGGNIGSWMVLDDTDITITDGHIGDNLHLLVGSHVHLNGGSIGNYFTPHLASYVTVDGGTIGHSALMQTGSHLTLNSGSIGGNFDVYLTSVVNVNGGSIGDYFDAENGSTININGGAFGNSVDIQDGATVNIRGGRFGQDFDVFAGSTVNIYGGDFLMDGQPIPGLDAPGDAVTLASVSTLTGTLEDGSVFIFSSSSEDNIDPNTVTLHFSSTPTPTPGTIHAPTDPIPNGLRTGQTLILAPGANVGDDFASVGGTLQVAGGSVGEGLEVADIQMLMTAGSVGDAFRAYHGSDVVIQGGTLGDQAKAYAGSTVTITDGTVGDIFVTYDGSTVNIEGGTFGSNPAAFGGSTVNISGGDMPSSFRAFANSEVNIIGQSILMTDPASPGDTIDLTSSLTPGVPLLLTSRVGSLSGLLGDGTAFSFSLAFFNSQSTLTVSLPALAGDLNLDGFVGLADLDILLANWNMDIPPGNPQADVSGPGGVPDGYVGLHDLDTVLGNWNTGVPPAARSTAAIPEPATLAIVGVACVLIRQRRPVA